VALAGYPVAIAQPIVPRDLDAYGHVNNAVYLTYIENGRVAYLSDRFGARYPDGIDNVIARVTIEFRAPLAVGDELEVGVRPMRVGSKSFELAYLLQRGDGEVAATAESVQVMFDFEAERAIEVPAAWRRLFEADLAATERS